MFFLNVIGYFYFVRSFLNPNKSRMCNFCFLILRVVFEFLSLERVEIIDKRKLSES